MRHRLYVLALWAVGCGGSYSTGVVPGLPGDGTANLTAPADRSGAGSKDDPWAGRDDLVAAPAATTAAAVAMPEVARFSLSNGLPVVLVRAPGAMSLQLAFRAGERDVTKERVGLASFTASALLRGTRTKNARALQDAADQAGVAISSNASYEVTRISCAGVQRSLPACLRLVAEMAISPAFPAKDLADMQAELVQSVRQQRSDPSALASLHFSYALFGDDHPRGWPMGEATLSKITRADVVAWHKARLRPNNALLVITADVDPKKLATDLEAAFRGWTKAALPKPAAATSPRLSGIKVRLVDQPGTAAQVRVGHFGLSHDAKDYYEAMVINRILGEGPESRLAAVIKGGSASSSFDRNADRGAFITGAVTKPADAVTAARALIAEMSRMASDGPSDAELARAVSSLVGQYLVRLDSARAIADTLLAVSMHGFDDAYVRDYALALSHVTRDSAAAAARARLDPSNVVVVIVGPASAIEPRLAEAGWVYEKVSAGDPIGSFESGEAQSGQKDAIALLDRALEAKGGFEKLSAIKTFVWSGTATLTINGQTAPATVTKTYVAPDKLRLDMEINNGQLSASTVFNGDEGWARQQPKEGEAQVVALPKAEVELGRGQLWRDQDFVLLRHRVEGARARKLPDEKIGDVAHDAVEVTSKDGKTSVVLLLDKKTHLIAGTTMSPPCCGAPCSTTGSASSSTPTPAARSSSWGRG